MDAKNTTLLSARCALPSKALAPEATVEIGEAGETPPPKYNHQHTSALRLNINDTAQSGLIPFELSAYDHNTAFRKADNDHIQIFHLLKKQSLALPVETPSSEHCTITHRHSKVDSPAPTGASANHGLFDVQIMNQVKGQVDNFKSKMKDGSVCDAGEDELKEEEGSQQAMISTNIKEKRTRMQGDESSQGDGSPSR